MSFKGGLFGISLILFTSPTLANYSLNVNRSLNAQIDQEHLTKSLKQNSIVFIGGEHDEANERFVKSLALKIRELDSDYNCMTWEESDLHAENMMTAHLDWNSFVDQFYKIDLRVGKIFSSVFGFHPNPKQIIPKNIKPLVEAGLTNIPIDHSFTDLRWLKEFKKTLSYPEESKEYWKNYVRLILNERNHHMSKSIQALSFTSICNKIIVSIGDAHLLNNPFSHKTNISSPSLPSYLKNIKSFNIRVNTEDSRIVQPEKTINYSGEEIRLLLSPIVNKLTSRWIQKIHNLNILNKKINASVRRKSMYMHDFELQKGVQILIDRSDITPNTLVLSDTGHDLPIAAQIASNDDFKVLHAFNFPEYLRDEPGNGERIIPQLQDWAKYLYNKQQSWIQSQSHNLVFIGLEGHRKGYNGVINRPILSQWLPNNDELKALGIEQVVYLYERHPDNKNITPMRDIAVYLESLNLPIKKLGSDCRRSPGC